MQLTHTELLNRLSDIIIMLPAHKPRLVAIDGRSAAGKTTLADTLAAHLQQRGCRVRCPSALFFPLPSQNTDAPPAQL